MKLDELAFFNQQLAAMLREGIPLEGALNQLCAGMRAGPLRNQIEQLEADLARGTPLKEALAARSLPDLYRHMVEIGARGNDLPGVLTLLADHYYRANALWTRLKGLMVYPLIVILLSLGLTILISVNFNGFLARIGHEVGLQFNFAPATAAIWMPPVILALAAVLGVAAACIPAWRASLRWRLPGFRDASLAQLASAMTLMLKNGTTLPQALALAEALESNTPAAGTLARWRQLVEAGQGKPAAWTGDTRPFPQLFLWLVQKGGEDIAAGFRKAAEIYQARASYRIEMALYGALPVSILLLGQMVLWQAFPLVRTMTWMMNALGSDPGSVGD
ncbi:MAG TPA: type II secretion system F family protein [Candidatus Paceibacterota bacterium]|nr:type II secretion system F family protein [Verrucomicrobiota bacterium]HSA12216.1 type II secretion system F family protein [Candidatus Paceibacterota bacterium]